MADALTPAQRSALSWRHTWDEGGPDFVLERARAGEPETIGRIMLHRPVHAKEDGWLWTLTSRVHPVGIPRPGFHTSGFEATQRGARDALVEAWRQEAAFRVVCRQHPRFAQMAPYTKDHIVNGQPVPPKRRALPLDGIPDHPSED